MTYEYTKLEAADLPEQSRTPVQSRVIAGIVRILIAILAASMLFVAGCTYFDGPMRRHSDAGIKKATVVLVPDAGNVTGTITFRQSGPEAPVQVWGTLYGLDVESERGFHIHEFGNLTDGCTSTGSHFNPFSTTHGAPGDSLLDRHVGDLGNIKSDENGVAKVDLKDVIGGISLSGERSIVGRALVVHTGTDDLGRGDNQESLKTGNAGKRAACGVVAIAV